MMPAWCAAPAAAVNPDHRIVDPRVVSGPGRRRRIPRPRIRCSHAAAFGALARSVIVGARRSRSPAPRLRLVEPFPHVGQSNHASAACQSDMGHGSALDCCAERLSWAVTHSGRHRLDLVFFRRDFH